jgi:hypothetical protein
VRKVCLSLTFLFLTTQAFALGPKYIGAVYPTTCNQNFQSCWSDLNQEFVNAYYNIQYPAISTGTAQNFTIINSSATNFTTINSTITNLTVTGTISTPFFFVKQAPINGKTTSGSTTTSATFVNTNLTASITPKSSASKIFVMASGAINCTAAANSYVTLARGSTNLSNSSNGFVVCNNSGSGDVAFGISVLDSPATISNTVYNLQLRSGTGGSSVGFLQSGTEAIMTLIEIGQ